MNKRITSLLLCFVMVFSMFATAVPALAAPPASSCTYSIEADKTSANPGDTINFTIYMQQTGNQNTMEGTLVIPDGLTFVTGSGKLEDGIKTTLGWDSVEWTPVPNMILNGFGSESFTETDKLALMKFQCTVDNDATAKDYEVTLIDLVADDENYETKNPTCIPATVNVTVPHTHVYDKEVATEGYLKTGATCTEAAVYYKSCECGAKGTETFTSGSALGHDYTKKVENNTYLKTAASNCTEYNVYWYACSRCDANAKDDAEATDKYYTSTTAGNHSFTEKIEDAAHYVADTGTDCQSVKKYYFDCAYCDQIGTTTWDSTTYGAHTEGTEWKFDENNHWHICTVAGCGVVIESSEEAHTPDHTGHATEEYAIKCTECGYVIEAQLGHTHVFDKEVATEAYKASDATCTAKATYYKSCACGEKGTATFEYGELADHNWTPATCTAPKTCSVCHATEGDPLGHTEGTEWKSDKDNHWHTCTVAGCGVVIESSKAAHTPDREAATETDPIKCSVCDYIITPALGMQDYIVEMPVSIAVKLTGDKKPAKETFKFEIYDLGVEDAEFEIVKDSITVENLEFDENGVAFIEGIIKIKVTGEDQLCNLTEGFSVRMVKGSTKGWTYASEQWRIEPFFENDALDLVITVKEIVDGEISEEYANGMSFAVSYEAVSEPDPTEPDPIKPDPTEPDPTEPDPTEPTESNPNTGALDDVPQTGDNSMMGLWIALLFVSGVGVVGTTIYSRKKKYTVK